MVLAGVGVVHVKRVSELCLYQAFVADVTFCRAVVFTPVFWRHNDRLFVGQLGPHHLFVVLNARQKPVHRVFPAVHERAVRMAVAFHDYVRKAADLVHLYFDRCLTFFSAAMYLPDQRFKVGVNHERRFHLLVVVVELHLVFALFGQLCSCGPFQLLHAFGFVPFQQLRRRVAVQTAFAEMFAAVMPALVIKQSVQPSHKGIMRFFVGLCQHQGDSWETSLFFAEPMHDHALSQTHL